MTICNSEEPGEFARIISAGALSLPREEGGSLGSVLAFMPKKKPGGGISHNAKPAFASNRQAPMEILNIDPDDG